MGNEFGDFNPIFVFASYAIVWVAFFAYLYVIARRQSDIRSQIDALEQSMGGRGYSGENEQSR